MVSLINFKNSCLVSSPNLVKLDVDEPGDGGVSTRVLATWQVAGGLLGELGQEAAGEHLLPLPVHLHLQRGQRPRLVLGQPDGSRRRK